MRQAIGDSTGGGRDGLLRQCRFWRRIHKFLRLSLELMRAAME
jgi:hypothetical protein